MSEETAPKPGEVGSPEAPAPGETLPDSDKDDNGENEVEGADDDDDSER